MSLLIAFVPRILLGYLAGLIYEKLCRKGINENVGIIAGALTGQLPIPFWCLVVFTCFLGVLMRMPSRLLTIP